jgi:hypothetical protein
VVNLEVLTFSPGHPIRSLTMNSVGIDLHKKTIVTCALNQDRRVVARRSLPRLDREAIVESSRGLAPFQAGVEATASYEWLGEAIEPLADRVVLAHPGKIHEIAHSKRKTDSHDAFVLAEKLAKDEVPRRTAPPQGSGRTAPRSATAGSSSGPPPA